MEIDMQTRKILQLYNSSIEYKAILAGIKVEYVNRDKTSLFVVAAEPNGAVHLEDGMFADIAAAESTSTRTLPPILRKQSAG